MSAVLSASFSTSFLYECSSLAILLHVDVLIFKFLRVAILECKKAKAHQALEASQWRSTLQILGGANMWDKTRSKKDHVHMPHILIEITQIRVQTINKLCLNIEDGTSSKKGDGL